MRLRDTARTLTADALDLVAAFIRPREEDEPGRLGPNEERVSEQAVPVTLSAKAQQMIERSEPDTETVQSAEPLKGSMAWRREQERKRQ